MYAARASKRDNEHMQQMATVQHLADVVPCKWMYAEGAHSYACAECLRRLLSTMSMILKTSIS